MSRILSRVIASIALVSIHLTGLSGQTEASGWENDYPIVLVHGWTGWGRSEMGDFRYWGGWIDLQEHLNAQGYRVHTAAVGPISSNWDRACELYAYIKGGRVDYGAAHAAEHGHARFGRQHEGLLPDWGEPDAEGNTRKIHLLTHSMGGQTARQLIELLYAGSTAERAFNSDDPGDGPHPLFQGGRTDWIRSLSTLSTPHDGSTLANSADSSAVMRIMFKALLELLEAGSLEGIYDLKLDQWETLTPDDSESFDAYLDRVLGSDIFTAKDFSIYDLSPEGARELNRHTPARPNIYYFSWATKSSRQFLVGEGQHGTWQLLPLFTPLSLVLGSCTKECMWRSEDPVSLSPDWFDNDGIVNTRSMSGPTLDSADVIVPWTGTPQPGGWNSMGIQKDWDHMDIIGLNRIWPFPTSARPDRVKRFYEGIAAQLRALPQ